MKKYHSFKQIDKELELLNKEAEQELAHIKMHYGDIKSSLINISSLSSVILGFIRNEIIAKIKTQLKRKKES